MKTIAGFRKTKYRGIEKVGWAFTLAAAAYNLIRLPKLIAEPRVMAPKKPSSSASVFKGRWRIEAMDLWDSSAVDLVEPGFISFNGEEAEMRFIAVHGWHDVRYSTRDGRPIAEFFLGRRRRRRSAIRSRLGYTVAP